MTTRHPARPPAALSLDEPTEMIQAITDEAVPERVLAARSGHLTGAADARTEEFPTVPDGPTGSAGMRTARTSGVVRAGAVMAVATLVSRATGFLAKILLLAALGAEVVSDAYNVANTLPNIVFELLIGGVLTSVAIPLLSRARTDPDGGEGYTQRLTTVAFVGLFGATVLAVLSAPLLVRLYMSGNPDTADQPLAILLAYLLLPQMFFYGVAALFGAILNTKERFAAPAWAPVANNLVLIGMAIVLLRTGGGVRGEEGLVAIDRGQYLLLGLGSTAGIVLQAIVLLPSLHRAGFRFRWRWGGDPRLKEAGGLMLWATGYVLVSQVGFLVTARVATSQDEGAFTLYSFASLLFQLPYGILGVSILTAIMPRMSRHAAAGDIAAVKDDQSLANRLSIVALTPIAAGIVVLAGAIGVLATFYGAVTLADALTVGVTVACLAGGLVPFAVTLVQMRVFYAMKDARTPTLINAIMVAVRVPLLILCVNLDDRLLVPGLAAATAVSYLVGAVVGEAWLRARYGPMGTRRTLTTLGKMIVASAAGAGAALLVERPLGLVVDGPGAAIARIVTSGVVALVVIVLVATLLKVEELIPLRRRIAGRLGIGAGREPAHNRSDGSDPRPHEQEQEHPTVTTSEDDRPGDSQTVDSHLDTDATRRLSVSGVGPRHFRGDEEPATTRLVPDRAADEPTRDTSEDTTQFARHARRSVLEELAQLGAEEQADTQPDGQPTDRAAAPELAPGATVGGRYRLINLVSADAAGNRFWRAKDTVLPRDMAVTLLPDNTGASATVARTLRAGRLHHIGLPQTLDVGTDRGQSYVVGQWVDGATLTELLAAGPLEPDVAMSVTAKISEAVAEAHRNGIALGAINPSLVRVNFDGQVRLSHVIAHGSATPDQDIRAVGALLYLMLTGTWPLPAQPDAGTRTADARGAAAVDAAVASDAVAALPPAPTRLGRELPPAEVRPQVPDALSALAERALHPEEPEGIHAVGAIAALLRSPELEQASAAGAAPLAEMPPLSPADRRLVRERRVKLSIAAVLLAAFAALIVIAVASLGNQFLASIAAPQAGAVPVDATPTPTPTPDSAAASPEPPAASDEPGPAAETPASPSVPAAAAVKVVGGTVYDPEGSPPSDYVDYVDRVFDGNETSAWLTWVYKRQFPSLKLGVGLALELEREATPTSVRVLASPGSTIEVRAARSAEQPLGETTVIGSGTAAAGPEKVPVAVDIPVTATEPSKFVVVFLTQLSPAGGQFQSQIHEVTVQGN